MGLVGDRAELPAPGILTPSSSAEPSSGAGQSRSEPGGPLRPRGEGRRETAGGGPSRGGEGGGRGGGQLLVNSRRAGSGSGEPGLGRSPASSVFPGNLERATQLLSVQRESGSPAASSWVPHQPHTEGFAPESLGRRPSAGRGSPHVLGPSGPSPQGSRPGAGWPSLCPSLTGPRGTPPGAGQPSPVLPSCFHFSFCRTPSAWPFFSSDIVRNIQGRNCLMVGTLPVSRGPRSSPARTRALGLAELTRGSCAVGLPGIIRSSPRGFVRRQGKGGPRPNPLPPSQPSSPQRAEQPPEADPSPRS